MRHGKLRARILLSSAIATALGVTASHASAAVLFWQPAGEGNWNVATNWDTSPSGTNKVPTGAPDNDTANINNGGTVDVTDAESFNLLSLGSVSGPSGTLNITSTGVLTSTTSDVRIGGNSSSTTNCVGTLNQSGILQMNGGNFNVGDGSGSAGVNPSVGNYNLSAGSLTISSGTIMAIGNRATGVVAQTGGTVYVRGGSTPTAGVIQLGRNTASVPARGTYTLSAGYAAAASLQYGNTLQTSNAAPTNTFNLQGTGTLAVSNITLTNTFATNNFNFTGGTLIATTINLPSLANAGGTLSPATFSFTGQTDIAAFQSSILPVGTTTINGNYTQDGTSKLAIDISDPTTFDKVIVTGTAGVDGTVAVNLLSGFDPALGSTFDVLSSTGALTGSAVATGTTPSGYTFSASEVGNTLRLTVVPEPTSLALIGLGAAGMLLRPARRRTLSPR